MILQNLAYFASLASCTAVLAVVLLLLSGFGQFRKRLEKLEAKTREHAEFIYCDLAYRFERLGKRFDALRDELFERSDEDRKNIAGLEKNLGGELGLINTSLNRELHDLAAHGKAIEALDNRLDAQNAWMKASVSCSSGVLNALKKQVHDHDAHIAARKADAVAQDRQIKNIAGHVGGHWRRLDDHIEATGKLSDLVDEQGLIINAHSDAIEAKAKAPTPAPCCLGLGEPSPFGASMLKEFEGIAASLVSLAPKIRNGEYGIAKGFYSEQVQRIASELIGVTAKAERRAAERDCDHCGRRAPANPDQTLCNMNLSPGSFCPGHFH